MQNLHLPNADVRLQREFLKREVADLLFTRLVRDIPWRQGHIRIQGRDIPEPRLTSWHGDGDYVYSGVRHAANEWTRDLLGLKRIVEEASGAEYNSVLLNYYRPGHRDSIGMHADDEPEFGRNPTIASVSLGQVREFILAPMAGREGKRTAIALPHGSLLVMAGATQSNWKHGIDKERLPSRAGRINLTFRRLVGR